MTDGPQALPQSQTPLDVVARLVGEPHTIKVGLPLVLPGKDAHHRIPDHRVGVVSEPEVIPQVCQGSHGLGGEEPHHSPGLAQHTSHATASRAPDQMSEDVVGEFMTLHQGQFVVVQTEGHQTVGENDPSGRRIGVDPAAVGLHQNGIFRRQVLGVEGDVEFLLVPQYEQFYGTGEVAPPGIHGYMPDIQHESHQHLPGKGQDAHPLGDIGGTIAAAPLTPKQAAGNIPGRLNLPVKIRHPGVDGPVVHPQDDVSLPEAGIVGRGGPPDVVDDDFVPLGNPPVEAQKGVGAAVGLGHCGQEANEDPGGALHGPGLVGMAPAGRELDFLYFSHGRSGARDFSAPRHEEQGDSQNGCYPTP